MQSLFDLLSLARILLGGILTCPRSSGWAEVHYRNHCFAISYSSFHPSVLLLRISEVLSVIVGFVFGRRILHQIHLVQWLLLLTNLLVLASLPEVSEADCRVPDSKERDSADDHGPFKDHEKHLVVRKLSVEST